MRKLISACITILVVCLLFPLVSLAGILGTMLEIPCVGMTLPAIITEHITTIDAAQQSISRGQAQAHSGLGRLLLAPKNVLAPAKRNSGSTVLGHYPEYMNLADDLGHRRFDIPTSVWDKMSDANRWGANQKFLDRTISRGDDILLSTPLDKVKPGSYFARELEYLSGKGYVPSTDGTRLIPGGN